MIVLNNIYQFIKSFLDNKMSIFEAMEPLTQSIRETHERLIGKQCRPRSKCGV